ncbi:hypothetical protein A3Q56_01667 [Intoshia linei]|uniref:RRM domain-containing protein n=1 Tax=Intoshia linei TaxID=1819745 RepID=A0A177BAE2_9BILA|nr:hypothetical protein A3Q56_01667 [Intoshia linei]
MEERICVNSKKKRMNLTRNNLCHVDKFKWEKPCRTIVFHCKNAAIEDIDKEFRYKFGNITRIFILPNFDRVLIEFEKVASSTLAISSCKSDSLGKLNNFRQPSFSYYKTIEDYISTDGCVKIIRFDIEKPIYPITINVMKKILKPYDSRLRIIIVSKSKILVEFSSISLANDAKKNLNDADIYLECCTIRTSYAEFSQLYIRENTETEYDYMMDTDYQKGSSFREINPKRTKNVHIPNTPTGYKNIGIISGCVLAIMGLANAFNCTKLFNLMCQYGNIVKIKILNRRNCGMVQMRHRSECKRTIMLLNGVCIYGSKLELSFSKLSFLIFHSNDSQSLADGTLSSAEYAPTTFNKFKKTKFHSFYAPKRTLFFSHVPISFKSDKINQVFKKLSLKEPDEILCLRRAAISKSGLMEWDNLDDAISAIMGIQHYRFVDEALQNSSTLKLSFASTTIRS